MTAQELLDRSRTCRRDGLFVDALRLVEESIEAALMQNLPAVLSAASVERALTIGEIDGPGTALRELARLSIEGAVAPQHERSVRLVSARLNLQLGNVATAAEQLPEEWDLASAALGARIAMELDDESGCAAFVEQAYLRLAELEAFDRSHLTALLDLVGPLRALGRTLRPQDDGLPEIWCVNDVLDRAHGLVDGPIDVARVMLAAAPGGQLAPRAIVEPHVDPGQLSGIVPRVPRNQHGPLAADLFRASGQAALAAEALRAAVENESNLEIAVGYLERAATIARNTGDEASIVEDAAQQALLELRRAELGQQSVDEVARVARIGHHAATRTGAAPPARATLSTIRRTAESGVTDAMAINDVLVVGDHGFGTHVWGRPPGVGGTVVTVLDDVRLETDAVSGRVVFGSQFAGRHERFVGVLERVMHTDSDEVVVNPKSELTQIVASLSAVDLALDVERTDLERALLLMQRYTLVSGGLADAVSEAGLADVEREAREAVDGLSGSDAELFDRIAGTEPLLATALGRGRLSSDDLKFLTQAADVDLSLVVAMSRNEPQHAEPSRSRNSIWIARELLRSAVRAENRGDASGPELWANAATAFGHVSVGAHAFATECAGSQDVDTRSALWLRPRQERERYLRALTWDRLADPDGLGGKQ